MNRARPVLLGMITPSSNTTLEPVTARSCRYPRSAARRPLPRHRDLDGAGRSPVDMAPMLPPPTCSPSALQRHLRRPSARWLGLGGPATCAESNSAPASTRPRPAGAARRVPPRWHHALRPVSPYTDDIQQAIVANYAPSGFFVAERHTASANFDFSTIEPADTTHRRVAAARPQAVVVLCTNMDGAAWPRLRTTQRRVAARLHLHGRWVAADGRRRHAARRRWGRLFSLTAPDGAVSAA